MDSPRLGYLIPEFPGQTHVWIWREIEQLRRWGLELRLFSTRRPPGRDRARHEFAAVAGAETTYLWPVGAWRLVASLLWALGAHPAGLARCVGLALTLPTVGRFRRARLLALLPSACVLARECHRSRITQLHSHSCGSAAVLCMMARRLVGLPYSLTLNANLDWWGGAMLEKLSEAEFTNTHAEWLLAQVREEFPGLARGQTLLARIGVDVDLWTPGDERPPSDGRARIISVGRLHRTKGHDVLLEAVHRLVSEGVQLSVVIVGDGPERPALEAQTLRLGLQGHVAFLGSRGQLEIIGQMRTSDVFVLASRFEPLGVAYMEAMAMGLATIGTTAGGAREIIDDGVDGVLVPPEQPAALAEAIRGLVRDPELRRRMGVAARRKIVNQFDSRLGAAVLYERFTGAPPCATGGPKHLSGVTASPTVRTMEGSS